jgi:hypothetical protein
MPIHEIATLVCTMIFPMIFGERSAWVGSAAFSYKWIVGILMLGCCWISRAVFAQVEVSIQLKEEYHRSQRYLATIGEDSIEMNLFFEGIINPEFASVYEWYGAVSGAYKFAGEPETFPLKGVLWNPDSLTLFVPDIAAGESCWLDLPQPDSIALRDIDNPERSLPVLEVFSLSPTGGFWRKDRATKLVKGVDFRLHGLERSAVLEIRDAKGINSQIDVAELVCEQLGLSHQEWIGYNGWADISVSLSEFTFVEGGVNVLLAIDVSGSCNTDRSYLLSCHLDDNGAMLSVHFYQVGNCLFYGAERSGGDAYRIMLHETSARATADSLRRIGSFEIVQSEVIIKKAWGGISSRNPMP